MGSFNISARCPCHPEVDIGTGEKCLNCGEPPEKHRQPVSIEEFNLRGGSYTLYCRNSTRQSDWEGHRREEFAKSG